MHMMAINKINIIIIVLSVILTITGAEDQQEQMKGVIIFLRHGPRVPVLEDYYPHFWKAENLTKGDLTVIGLKEVEKVGKLIRQRYKDFLPQEYIAESTKVYLSLIQRCKYSLLAFLRGCFPDLFDMTKPISFDNLNDLKKPLGFSLNFKDYPPRELIFRPMSNKNCPYYEFLSNKLTASQRFDEQYFFFKNHRQAQSIREKLTKYRNSTKPIEFTSWFHIKEIYDSYLANKKHDKPVPDFNELDIKFLDMAYTHYFYKFFCHREARLFYASTFFKQVVEHLEGFLDEHKSNNPTLYLYSGTKTNIVIFLSTLLVRQQILDMKERKMPPLSAVLTFEIWDSKNTNIEIDERLLVRVKYGEEYLELRHCKKGTTCTVKEFLILAKTRVFKNVDQMCFKRVPYSDYPESMGDDI